MERITTTVDRTTLTARNADLQSLVTLLQEADTRKVDIVAPAHSLMAWKGNLHVKGAEPVLTADGVDTADGIYRPGAVGIEGIAEKIGVPMKYLRSIHDERPDLWDATVNHHLRGGFTKDTVTCEPDTRSFLVRTFRPVDGNGPGILRSFLSDRYAIMDSTDALMSVLDGVREAGVRIEVTGADITERRMQVRIAAPEITAVARTLMKGYRSPFNGQSGDDLPVVEAGLLVSNSETGHGSLQIQPRVRFRVCANGATIDPMSAIRNVHLGGRMDHGVVQWSQGTQEKNLDLARSMTVDAVRTFLSEDYLRGAIERLERKADETVASVDAVRDVTKKAGFTKEQTEGILSHFISAGQMTRAGIFNSATSWAQTLADGDSAAEVEALAVNVLA